MCRIQGGFNDFEGSFHTISCLPVHEVFSVKYTANCQETFQRVRRRRRGIFDFSSPRRVKAKIEKKMVFFV
jgi:hypothetical protein